MKKDWMVRESELDDWQFNVLSATLDKSIVVSGCAGSGKSILAMMLARRIKNEVGEDCEIIVYTNTLSRYMNLCKMGMGLSVPIFVHYQWKNHNKPSAAYVIVDEVQDFTREQILEFVDAAKKQFVFFGDTAQSIFDPFKENAVRVEDIVEDLPIQRKMKGETLYYNYRLPVSVAKFVQHVGVGLPEFDEDKYKNPVDAIPYILSYDNIQEQLVTIKRIINRDDSPDDVAILLPTNNGVRLVSRYLTELDVPHEVKYNDVNRRDELDFNTTNPKVMTYHSAKGLQFETVFVPCVDSYRVWDEGYSNALYVAMTRTYKDLYVMYSGSMPEVLKNIPSELYKNSVDKDAIDDI